MAVPFFWLRPERLSLEGKPAGAQGADLVGGEGLREPWIS